MNKKDFGQNSKFTKATFKVKHFLLLYIAKSYSNWGITCWNSAMMDFVLLEKGALLWHLSKIFLLFIQFLLQHFAKSLLN